MTSAELRFLSKVDKGGPILRHELGPCWLWTASLSALGYGQFRFGPRRPAHRVAWELTHGPIPPKLCVLHRCDNRACVNVAHLWLGTHADNMRDMAKKGRSTRGERSRLAKLAPTEVLSIRAERARGARTNALAHAFGVSERAVRHIVDGDRWRHIPHVDANGQLAFAWGMAA